MLKDMSINDLAEVYQYDEDDSLSYAIILSSLSLGSLKNPKKYFSVKSFRENPFSELWRKHLHHGSNWKAQYRSELNQGDGRLAHRVFESPDGEGHDYRLKDIKTLSDPDRAIIEKAQRIISTLEEGGSVVEASDEAFQTAIRISEPIERLPDGPINKPEKRTQERRRGYKGSPGISRKALVEFGNVCAYDSSHTTFHSPTLGGNYVEMHHIIPISKQDDFEYSIDLPANIVPLCPNCHRQIHHSGIDIRNEMLTKLYTGERVERLKERGLILELVALQDYY